MKKRCAITLALVALVAGMSRADTLLHSFETSLEGWTAETGVTLTRVPDHATAGNYAVKAEHSDPAGTASLMSINQNVQQWWDAIRDSNNTTMTVDLFVPASAIDASWAKVTVRLFGSNFDLTAETNLTVQADNQVTVELDFSSIASELQSATWGKALISINGATGSSRTPVYIDNYQISDGSTPPPSPPPGGTYILQHSFESSTDGWQSGSSGASLTRVTVNSTDGSYSLKADHSDPLGIAELTYIASTTSTDWWDAMRTSGSTSMSVDLVVPASAIDASWAKVTMRLYGDSFDISAESNLTVQADNSVTLTLDFSSISSQLQSASWGKVSISINGATGSTRTPVYIDNYRIEGESAPEPTEDILLLHSFETSNDDWLAATGVTLTRLTDHATEGSYAIRATHSDPSGQAALMYISNTSSVEWWNAMKDPDSTSMAVDLFVPASAIDASWAKVTMRLYGDGFDITAESNLVVQTDNSVILSYDLSSISSLLQSASWGTIYISINAGTGSTRTPVYIDNYRVIGQSSGPFSDPVQPAPVSPPSELLSRHSGLTWFGAFTDNFDSDGLDGAKWKSGTYSASIAGLAGQDVNNIGVSDGALCLMGTLDPEFFAGEQFPFSGAEVSTIKRFRVKYGYMESRLRYTGITGAWPAFWTMPDRQRYGNQDKNHKSFLKFNLSSVSGPIQSAELKLRVKEVEATSLGILNIYPVADDSWSETGITWNNMPVENPLWLYHDSDWPLNASVTETRTYDVTEYIQQEFAGDKTASFALYDTFSKDRRFTLGSRESSLSTEQPKLVINGTEYTASADAYVQGGNYASANFGTSTDLLVEEAYYNNNSTTFIFTNELDEVDNGMEIDILEALGDWPLDEFQSAIHWDGYWGAHQSIGFESTISNGTYGVEQYHTYGLYWAPGLLEFYLDGELQHAYTNSRVCSAPSYIILSMQMGGWGNNLNTNLYNAADYPVGMDVDYVKVWTNSTYH